MIKGKKETVFAFGYSIASKVIVYLVLLVFANLYLPSEYGMGSFVFNIRNLIMLFVFLGLPDALIPLLVKKKKIGSIFGILSIITCFIFGIGLILTIKFPWIFPLVITFPLIMLTSIAMAFWRAKSKYDYPIKVGLFSIILTLIFAYLLKDYGKFGVITAYSIGNLFSFIAIAYPIRKELILNFKEKNNFNLSKAYFKSALTITMIGSIFTLFNWVNSTLLGFFGKFESVAEFSIASSIAGVVAIIPFTLSMFMITRAGQIASIKKSKRVLHRVTRISFFCTLLLSSILISFIFPIIKIFFSQYVGSEIYIAILTIGMVFFSSYYIIYSYYVGKLKSEKALFPVILGIMINLILGVILIPIISVLGVVIAISLAHFIILLIISKNEEIKKILLMSFFSVFFILIVFKLRYFGIIFSALLTPLCLFFKIITKEDLLVIKNTIYEIITNKKDNKN